VAGRVARATTADLMSAVALIVWWQGLARM
jgi:hypothetical protein